MTVNVTRPPGPPQFTGQSWRADMRAMYRYCRDLSRWAQQMYERTGATTDFVSSALDTASTASTTANASQAGAVIPTPGGAVELNPTNPLSYVALTAGFARIDIAQHTRTGAAAPLLAGSVASVIRENTYYVYYSDAGDLGGSVTYLASTSLSTVTGTAGYRIVGTIYVAANHYSGEGGGGSEP